MGILIGAAKRTGVPRNFQGWFMTKERSRTRATLVTTTVALVATACGTGAADQDGAWAGTVRDSAGVSIVSNPEAGIWTDADRWILTEDLRIGTSAGDPDYQFGQISGIAELGDGRLLVLDAQAQHLRLFSATGVYERTVGGAGSGPGEFGVGAGPVLIGPGDSIYVPDVQNQRINKFTPEVEPVGSSPLDFASGIPLAWRDTPEGRIISQIRPFGLPGQQAADSLDLVLERGSDGLVLDTLLSFPSGRTFLMRDGVPDFTFFAAEPVWTLTSAGQLVYGYNNTYRLQVYEGRDLVRIIGKTFEPQPVSAADQELMIEGIVGMWEDLGVSGEQVAVLREAIGFADAYPAYATLQGGPEGSLWVQHLQLPSELTPEEREHFNPTLGLGSRRWDVFDPEGRFMGELEMPQRFQPLRIEHDRIYGIWRDDLDVQYVLILRVHWDAAELEGGRAGP